MDGEYKIRGLAYRREDTPLFVSRTQLEILEILSQEKEPARLGRLLPEVIRLLQQKITSLDRRSIPLEEFIITQTLSRDLSEYSVPSPAARAATQLQMLGKNVQRGQRIQFIYSMTEPGVSAWDIPQQLPASHVDIPRYKTLLDLLQKSG